VTTLDRDGVAVHYEVHGSGSRLPVLLSHGYGSSSAMWAGNLAALARDRLVVTWDIRGHGFSASPEDPALYSHAASVADMAAVLDACHIDRAAVGGLSLGGYLSLAFWLAHPERVGALLLFDTGPGYRSDAARRRWNRWAEAQADALEAGTGGLSDSPEVRLGRHDRMGLARAGRGILTQDTSHVIEALTRIDVPTLVLVGSDDHAFVDPAHYMATRIPGATAVVLDGAGHAANLDRPAAFDRAVTAFLDGLG